MNGMVRYDCMESYSFIVSPFLSFSPSAYEILFIFKFGLI
jgi:hypothetical protein